MGSALDAWKKNNPQYTNWDGYVSPTEIPQYLQYEKNKGNVNISGGGGGNYNDSSNSMYAAYMAQQQALMEEQRRARASARDSSISSANNAYNKGLGDVNKTVDNALQQAYINRKMSERDLPQNLSAMGFTGGMSESTAAGMRNQYGNSRNNLENQRAQNVSDLQANLQDNIANAEQAYQGGLMSDLSNDINYQRSALDSNLAKAYANNKSGSVTVQQGGTKDLTKVGVYGRIKSILDNTGDIDSAISEAGNLGLSSNEIHAFIQAYMGR